MTKRAALYARISKDAEQEGLGVERQVQDCQELAKNKGWDVVEVYVDNDISASTISQKARPEYQRMLEDARAGKFEVITAYSNSRLTRRPAEWIELINLANSGKVQISTKVSGQHDLTTADGRAVALTVAVWDAAEAERVGERVARAAKQRAEKGIPQKGRYRVYGYTRDWVVIPEEAKVIKEAFERRAKGESTTSIANDFTKRGLKTVAGKDWKSGTLGTTLTKHVYCGLRTYKGDVVGDSSVPALITKELFEEAQANLANDKKGTNTRKYLLSGILLCGHCLSPMKGNPNGMYRCSANYGGCGRLSVKIDNADPYVMHAAFGKYASTVGNAKVSNVVDFSVDIANAEREIKRLQDGYKADIYTLKEVQPLIKQERQRLKELVKRQGAARPAMPKIQRKYLDYFKGNLSQKRVFIGEFIDNVVVHPLATPGRKFDPSRLEAHYTDGTKERLEVFVEDPNPED